MLPNPNDDQVSLASLLNQRIATAVHRAICDPSFPHDLPLCGLTVTVTDCRSPGQPDPNYIIHVDPPDPARPESPVYQDRYFQAALLKIDGLSARVRHLSAAVERLSAKLAKYDPHAA